MIPIFNRFICHFPTSNPSSSHWVILASYGPLSIILAQLVHESHLSIIQGLFCIIFCPNRLSCLHSSFFILGPISPSLCHLGPNGSAWHDLGPSGLIIFIVFKRNGLLYPIWSHRPAVMRFEPHMGSVVQPKQWVKNFFYSQNRPHLEAMDVGISWAMEGWV